MIEPLQELRELQVSRNKLQILKPLVHFPNVSINRIKGIVRGVGCEWESFELCTVGCLWGVWEAVDTQDG